MPSWPTWCSWLNGTGWFSGTPTLVFAGDRDRAAIPSPTESGTIAPPSRLTCAIVFVWTPVHFWALALLLKDDYAAAGVPMLPVVKGERNTVLQIAGYTLLTVIVTLLPFAQHQVGWLYALSAVALNTILVVLCIKLYRTTDKPRASGLFHFSMLYLAILFLMVAIDRAVVIT